MNQVKPTATSKSIEQTSEEDSIWIINNVFPIVVVLAGMGLAWKFWSLWKDEWVYDLAIFWHKKLKTSEPLSIAELGQAGDIFGGINALFAAFAFIGVACAAYYQRKTFLQQLEDSKASAQAFKETLDQQKVDALENKTALQESRRANKEQSDNAKKELFNSFFFRMLSEVDSTMKNIHLTDASVFGKWFKRSDDDKDRDEASIFSETMEHIDSELNGVWHQIDYAERLKKQQGLQGGREPIDFVTEYHAKLYKPNRRTLAPFLRNFFHTFTIIKEQNISYSEQCKYSKVARASINEQILILVMLNGLSEEGKNLKPIIERYGLLKHLSDDGYTRHAKLIAKNFYKPNAFLGYGERKKHYGSEAEITT